MNVGANRLAATPNNVAKVAATCPNTTAQIDLDVNQVRARVLVGGDLWWDPIGQTPYYEVPIGSNKNSIYSGALWIGGYDQSNQLFVAAQTYRQAGGNDFWGGPISKDVNTGAVGIADPRCIEFDRFWSIKREDVENFIADGTTTTDIETWPGNGNVANGELPNLAPYFDANNDGTYNYEDGDYPFFKLDGDYPTDPNTGETICNDYLFGDESIWWVFNDVGGLKTETNSNPIGLEIRAQAFAFSTSNDINFMTFYKYQIINRSSNTLDSTYFGVWCDPDLGNASDDYVGCDVGLGLGYCYNGDPDDDGGGGYGLNPPAVGIDFFQGPLADTADGIDNNRDGQLDEPGEQITMSRFVYYTNTNGAANGNPDVSDDYYQYLSGSWLDGQTVTYGGDGRGAGTGATTTPCEFMFPGTTDPNFATPWTMVTASLLPTDMRWLQSAGIFTLQPGAVNYITTGVVWGRAATGGPLASVSVIKRADDLAQRLFNNCFAVLDGPDAPNLAIREMDRQIILSIENTRNDKVEAYSQFDKNIPGVVAVQVNDSTVTFDTLTTDERSFKFQGYKVYQVSDRNVSVSDINDPAKAKLMAQIDLKDDVKQLVNFTFDNALNAYVPTLKAEEVNGGINHNFIITQDMFTLKPLANYSPYYFLVISYASNNFRDFDPLSPNTANSQPEPYLQGRKNVKVYSAIPHKQVVNNGGMIANVSFGDGFKIKRIEGTGNGGNVLDLTDETVTEILNSADNRALNPVYQPGRGPIDVTTYDPLRLKGGGFKVMFDGVDNDGFYGILNQSPTVLTVSNINISQGGADDKDTLIITTASLGNIEKGMYVLLDNVGGITSTSGINKNFFLVEGFTLNPNEFFVKTVGATGTYTGGTGTCEIMIDRCFSPFSSKYEQLLENNKLAFNIFKITGLEPGDGAVGNGFLEATKTYTNASKPWLGGIADSDNSTVERNWILAGEEVGDLGDDKQDYEGIIGGTWAPFKLTSRANIGLPKLNIGAIEALAKWNYLASVDVVLTSEKSKWTRCVVVETGEDTMPNIGAAKKFDKRKHASVDKNGNVGDGVISSDPNDADFISDQGMGWFPGYAINVETGERLNIVFGENSSLDLAQNSRDMLFNPSSNGGLDSNGRLSNGGMHYIYIFNKNGITVNDVPIYDNGAGLNTMLSLNSVVGKRNAFKDCIWTSLPLLNEGYSVLESDVKIRLRVAKDYKIFNSIGATAVNNSNPLYEFEVSQSEVASTGQTELAKNALDYIRVVPNPYYAYSTYERTRVDQLDNRVRVTNLPSKCTVTIYTVNGTLIRQFKRDVPSDVTDGLAIEEGQDFNLATTLDWDLKNTSGITVASGVYIIHVDAGALGEKVVKWFGIMRPIDLDSF
ncbi:MAG: hypothetical protein IPO63_10300 [Bacteroidetes bacterium]|nr:hypothetical protein [Bacteroidota bacterium]